MYLPAVSSPPNYSRGDSDLMTLNEKIEAGKFIVTAELPSQAPIDIQAQLLNHYLDDISDRFPQQKIHLIAHSSGGIVARLALVNNLQQEKHYNMAQLITIASPHLGTVIAEIAKRASATPVVVIAPLLGADGLNRSKILYRQLSREKNNHFLSWLNQQAHPVMYYTSIIRGDGSLFTGDWLVPASSQNMAMVPVIGHQARVIITPGDHNLKYADGFILLNLLP